MLEKLPKKLPIGWTFNKNRRGTDCIWTMYREAEAATALKDGELRVFIRLLIYETKSSFTVYRVASFATPSSHRESATRISNLPPFLAVAKDTFVEMELEEAMEGLRKKAGWCKFHTAVGKGDTQGSCAWALFAERDEAVRKLCKFRVETWTGTQTAYMGKRRWAISAQEAQSIDLHCPATGRKTITVPALGTFELQAGCTGRTREWIFPASIEGQSEVDLGGKLRKLPPPKEARRYETPTAAMAPHREDEEARSELDQIAELVKRNKDAIRNNDLTVAQAKELAERENNKPYSHFYPFEWIIATVLLISLAAWKETRDRRMARAMAARENLVKARISAAERWILDHDFSAQHDSGLGRPASIA